MKLIIAGIFLITHLILAWRTQVMINRSPKWNAFQKRFNSIFNWIIPFAWSFIVRSMISPPKNSTMTKVNRKRRGGKNTDNWENLTGYGG